MVNPESARVSDEPRFLNDAQAARLAEMFKVLADPTRLRIISALSKGELCVGDLSALLGMTESAVSHQLALLRALKLVRATRRGRSIYYDLDDEHILSLFTAGLEHVEE